MGIQDISTAYIREKLESRGIRLIFWPAFSPDLNPIENVWNKMKGYLQHYFSEDMSYDQLRAAVREAWDAVGEDYLRDWLNQWMIAAGRLFARMECILNTR